MMYLSHTMNYTQHNVVPYLEDIKIKILTDQVVICWNIMYDPMYMFLIS